jgi:hypothetical protein
VGATGCTASSARRWGCRAARLQVGDGRCCTFRRRRPTRRSGETRSCGGRRPPPPGRIRLRRPPPARTTRTPTMSSSSSAPPPPQQPLGLRGEFSIWCSIFALLTAHIGKVLFNRRGELNGGFLQTVNLLLCGENSREGHVSSAFCSRFLRAFEFSFQLVLIQAQSRTDFSSFLLNVMKYIQIH